jgi:hypothetical protein
LIERLLCRILSLFCVLLPRKHMSASVGARGYALSSSYFLFPHSHLFPPVCARSRTSVAKVCHLLAVAQHDRVRRGWSS